VKRNPFDISHGNACSMSASAWFAKSATAISPRS
jgi:hypothetical protein